MTAPQLTQFAPGTPVTSVSADQLNTMMQTCDNFTQLRAFVGVPGLTVFARGGATIADGQQGIFGWATGAAVDDNVNTIVPTLAFKGSWKRLTTVSPSSATYLNTVNNLSDVPDKVTAVSNLFTGVSQFPIGQVVATQNIATVTNQGAYAYGMLSFTDVGLPQSFAGSINGYFQHIIQNTTNGSAASADVIVSNNLGTASTYYGDFGINSSTFVGTGALNQANATYVYSANGDLAIGTYTSNPIHFVVNNDATDAMTISAAGVVSLGTALAITSGGTGATTAVGAFNAMSYQSALSNTTARTASGKAGDITSIKDFAVHADGATDDGAIINTAIASKVTTGGQLTFPSAYYYLTTPVVYTASNSGEIDVSNATVSLRGEGAQNTIFKGASYLTTVLTIKGNDSGTVASHGYETHGDFGVYNAAMNIQSKAYTKFQNINLALANLTVTSCLVCEFSHISVRSVVGNGITITQGTGFSEHNNNLWSRLTLSFCSSWGMTTGSSQYVTNHNMQSVDVEACGTQGNASTGGIYLAFNDDQGGQGGAINGGYFENNAGNADLQLNNAGSSYVPFTVENCNFNRVSNTNFTTYNIVLTGKIRLLVKGCSFREYGTYVASSGRPYIYCTDGLAEIIYDDSTYFQSAVSTPGYTVMRPLQAVKEAVAWVRFNVSGGVCTVANSSGLAASTPVVYNGVGDYTINYANTLANANGAYNITVTGAAGVGYLWAETTSSVRIRTATYSGTPATATLTDFGSVSVVIYGS